MRNRLMVLMFAILSTAVAGVTLVKAASASPRPFGGGCGDTCSKGGTYGCAWPCMTCNSATLTFNGNCKSVE